MAAGNHYGPTNEMYNPKDLPPHYTPDENPRAQFYAPAPTAPSPSQYVITQQPAVAIYTVGNSASPGPVVLIQPGQSESIPMAGEGRDWKSGVCDFCSDTGTCCYGWLCPCCMLCSILNSMDELTCCVCVAGPQSMALLARVKIRTALKIKGSFCGDICCTQMCFSCVACQMYRELKHTNNLKGSCCSCGCDSQKQCLCQ